MTPTRRPTAGTEKKNEEKKRKKERPVMAKTRRKKKRTHASETNQKHNFFVGGTRTALGTPSPASSGIPKTFVVKRGKLAHLVKSLTEDVRKIMEPHTASKLKDSKSNKLKDFIQVAGPLGVTHFVLLSATERAKYLKICKTPRGPTLTFRIDKYSLEADVKKAQKNPKSRGKSFLNPALVVLNNFSSGNESETKLCALTFQNIFPAVNVKKAKLSSCKRVVLVDYDKETNLYRLRHFHVDAKPAKGDRKLRKMLKTREVPDMGRMADISEFFTGGMSSQGSDSDVSDSEDDPKTKVELAHDLDRVNKAKSTAKILLKELGPRLDLELVKVEEGACEGRVLFHQYVEKTIEEVKTQEELRAQKEQLKIKRRKEQEENVKRKEREKERKERETPKKRPRLREKNDDEKNGDDDWPEEPAKEYKEGDVYEGDEKKKKKKKTSGKKKSG